MADYLLSVVIPTYNRYEYLIPAIKSMLRITSNKLEIVVQDNTVDNEPIISFLNEVNDERVRYYHIKEHISMTENCEFGVSNSTGKYVCLIGDDDTICESMLNAATYCDENDVEACMFTFPGFNWPDMTFEGGMVEEANLFYTMKVDGLVSKLDSMEILMGAIRSAEGLPRTMPRAYHGLVSRRCLDKVKSKCGWYFPGPSPDIANSAAVSLVANKCVYISDYLMVSGYGYKSARGEGNRKQHYGKISDKPWLPEDVEDKWIEDVPRIFSGETIFAQSLLQSLNAMGRQDLAAEYNYPCLYAMFLAHHRDALGYMLKFCFKKPKRIWWMIKGIIVRSKIRKEYLKNPKERNYIEEQGIKTLEEAQDYTEKLRESLVSEYLEK